jgi:signal transduction histidine kinase
MKLSSKFILSIIVLIILTISIVIFLTVQKENAIIRDQIRKKGFVLSEVLAMSSVNAFLNYDYSTLKRYIDTIVKDEDVISVIILDKDCIVKMHSNIGLLGTKLDDDFNTNTLEGLKPKSQIRQINRKEHIYDIAMPIIVENQKLGLVRISLTSQNAFLDIQKSTHQLLIIAFIACFIGIVGAVIMANRISKPIKQLVAGAKAISEGNLDWNVNIKSKDELGILSDAFGYMTRNLRNHIESLVKTEKLAVLGQLASVIAHEVRNPMEPIKGSAELLQNAYKKDAVIKKYTQIIKEEISELSSFLDGFLEFARPPDPTFQFIEINSLIEETLSLTQQYLTEHNMSVDKSFSENIPSFYGDPQQLKQVFMNIVLNAAQAKKKGAGLLKVKSYLKKNNDFDKELRIEFFDYGQGISDENIHKIFDPFYTTKKDGTGLGLSTCFSIVERHKGKIEIESELGQWTLVRICLKVIDLKETLTSKEYE